MLRIFLLKNNYSIEPYMNIRNIISSKICYRPTLSFLKYKTSLSQSLSNRLVIRGNYLRSYINFRNFYISNLRANFGNNLSPNFAPFYTNNFDNKKFLLLYTKTKLTREFDYILYWRGSQINSLFNLSTVTTKKKKKLQFKQRIFFVKPENRLHFVWKWLNIFVRSTVVKKTARQLSLVNSLENFIHAEEAENIVFDFKLQLYKLYLMRVT